MVTFSGSTGVNDIDLAQRVASRMDIKLNYGRELYEKIISWQAESISVIKFEEFRELK